MDNGLLDKTYYKIPSTLRLNQWTFDFVDCPNKEIYETRGPGDTLLTRANMAVTDQLFGIKYKIF